MRKLISVEVRLAGNLASVVLADQVKSVDWRAPKAVRKGKGRASGVDRGSSEDSSVDRIIL